MDLAFDRVVDALQRERREHGKLRIVAHRGEPRIDTRVDQPPRPRFDIIYANPKDDPRKK